MFWKKNKELDWILVWITGRAVFWSFIHALQGSRVWNTLKLDKRNMLLTWHKPSVNFFCSLAIVCAIWLCLRSAKIYYWVKTLLRKRKAKLIIERNFIFDCSYQVLTLKSKLQLLSAWAAFPLSGMKSKFYLSFLRAIQSNWDSCFIFICSVREKIWRGKMFVSTKRKCLYV